MEIDLEAWSKEQFKAAQRPIAWLLSAERLRDSAEIICKHEQAAEIPYFRAYAAAQEEAVAEAYSDGRTAGVVEIKAIPPNYPPAQLLYAFAIENVLKGLIVTNTPGLIDERRLNDELTTHNLIELAEKAQFAVQPQERKMLEALSHLSVWAARYPAARTPRGICQARFLPKNGDAGSADARYSRRDRRWLLGGCREYCSRQRRKPAHHRLWV